MAKRTRRTSKRTAETHDRGRFRRHPGVWLATLSTVVGAATGVCDELNDNDDFRARDETAIKRRLQQARTTVAQRNALVDGVRRTASRSANALASFNALETPTALAAVGRDTEAAWNRHLARLRGYALSLDRAGTRAQLVATLDQLTTLRPALARDSDKLRSGLGRLGVANCDLEAQIVTRTFTLPRLDADKSTRERTSPSRNRRSDQNPPANGPTEPPVPPLRPPVSPAPPPPTGPNGANPPANPPVSPAPPSPTGPANPPGAPGGPTDG